MNVKPSRIGGLRGLFEVYARCERERRPMYGGGMGELGVGRGQIELLAALFHPDAPNDVAPSAYNEDDPPGGLPASPLAPRPEATGFRWATSGQSGAPQRRRLPSATTGKARAPGPETPEARPFAPTPRRVCFPPAADHGSPWGRWPRGS